MDNGNYSDNYWFGEDYTKDCDLPIILDKKHLGTYSHVLMDSELSVKNKAIYLSDAINGFEYQAVLKDENNNPINGMEVQFVFNGKNHTSTTDFKGIAQVRLTALKTGIYNVKVIFKGNNDYSQTSRNAIISVLKQSTEFDGDNGNEAKIPNETIKSETTSPSNITSKENKVYFTTITNDYGMAIYIVALVVFGIIAVIVKRKNDK